MLSDRKYQIIEVLTGVAKSAVKEKVSRMVIATFRVGSSLPTSYHPDVESRTVLQPFWLA